MIGARREIQTARIVLEGQTDGTGGWQLAEGSRSTKRIDVPRHAGFHAEVSAQPALDRSLESEGAAAEAHERRHSAVDDDRERQIGDVVGIDRVATKDTRRWRDF